MEERIKIRGITPFFLSPQGRKLFLISSPLRGED